MDDAVDARRSLPAVQGGGPTDREAKVMCVALHPSEHTLPGFEKDSNRADVTDIIARGQGDCTAKWCDRAKASAACADDVARDGPPCAELERGVHVSRRRVGNAKFGGSRVSRLLAVNLRTRVCAVGPSSRVCGGIGVLWPPHGTERDASAVAGVVRRYARRKVLQRGGPADVDVLLCAARAPGTRSADAPRRWLAGTVACAQPRAHRGALDPRTHVWPY